MTDADRWLTEQRPEALLYHAKRRKVLTRRKARLFACGCYRLLWDRITDDRIKHAVEQVEACADRLVKQATLRETVFYPWSEPEGSPNYWLSYALSSLVIEKPTPGYIAWRARVAVDPARYEPTDSWGEYPPQAELVRDVIADPFRPVKWSPKWRTATAVALAGQMYESRDFAVMPILADALQDAGCADDRVLSHCRDGGVHVRGCWVVDLVLGKV